MNTLMVFALTGTIGLGVVMVGSLAMCWVEARMLGTKPKQRARAVPAPVEVAVPEPTIPDSPISGTATGSDAPAIPAPATGSPARSSVPSNSGASGQRELLPSLPSVSPAAATSTGSAASLGASSPMSAVAIVPPPRTARQRLAEGYRRHQAAIRSRVTSALPFSS